MYSTEDRIFAMHNYSSSILLQVYSQLLEISAAASNNFKTSATRNFGAAGANNLYLFLAALPGVHKLFSRPLEPPAAATDYEIIAARSYMGRRGEYFTFTLLL